jgi:nitrogen fixation protein NifU and related proteins
MELDSLYQEVILDHYKHPQHKSLSPNPTVQVHHVNTSCGDEITLNLHTNGTSVEDITWDGVGCSISQASTSVVSDLVRGKSIAEALTIIDSFQAMIQSKGNDAGNEDVLGDGVAFAGVAKFPARVKCALLGWMAVKDAISQSQRTQSQRMKDR